MKVAQGKAGWLFLDNDTNHVVSQITGERLFTPQELYQWKLLLEMRSAWLKQRGASYYFLVAPNKACVYPEHLPDTVHLSEERCVHQLSRYLAGLSNCRLIYPIEELRAAKSEMLTYRLTDTHWTSFGAYIGYFALMTEIAKFHATSIITPPDVLFEVYDEPISDLGSKLGLPGGSAVRAAVVNPQARCLYNNEIIPTGNLMVYENTNRNLPRVMLFRDSFSNFLLSFLAESCSRLVVVWQPNLDYSLIESERPDIVISQQVERFMIQIPDDLKGPTNKELIELKMNQEIAG